MLFVPYLDKYVRLYNLFGGLFGVKLLYISRAAGRYHYSKMTSLDEDWMLHVSIHNYWWLSFLVLNYFILIGLRYALTYDGMLHTIVLKFLANAWVQLLLIRLMNYLTCWIYSQYNDFPSGVFVYFLAKRIVYASDTLYVHPYLLPTSYIPLSTHLFT